VEKVRVSLIKVATIHRNMHGCMRINWRFHLNVCHALVGLDLFKFEEILISVDKF
jgi:hypothetical protein